MPQWKASRLAGAGLALLLASGLAFAQGGYHPNVPKVRITDVRSVPGDLEGDRFQFMFEIVNWTGSPANGLRFVANIGSTLVPTNDGFDTKVRITGAEVRAAGRPIQPADVNGDGVINTADLEDANRNGVLDPGEDKNSNGRLDNDPLPGNPAQTNDWRPGIVTPTSAAWDAGTALGFRDLGALPNAGTRCPLIPGCALSGRLVTLPDPETADNGGNALDGFIVEVDGWEPGETISFNWYLLNGGMAIPGAYANGVITLMREYVPFGGPLTPGGFVGDSPFFQQDPLHLFFGGVYRSGAPAVTSLKTASRSILAAAPEPEDRWFSLSVNPTPAPAVKAAELPTGLTAPANGIPPNYGFRTLVSLAQGPTGQTMGGFYKITASFRNISNAVLGQLCFVKNTLQGASVEPNIYGANGKPAPNNIVCPPVPSPNKQDRFPAGVAVPAEFWIKLKGALPYQPFVFTVDAFDGSVTSQTAITIDKRAVHALPGRNPGKVTVIVPVTPGAARQVTLQYFDWLNKSVGVAHGPATKGRAEFDPWPAASTGLPQQTTWYYLRAEYVDTLGVTRFSNLCTATWSVPPLPGPAVRVLPPAPDPDREF